MRLRLKKRLPGELEFGIIYGGIALLALSAGRALPVTRLFPSCVFKGLTGIPCPTCGSTRSVVSLSQGHVLDSFAANPLLAACLMTALLYFIYSLIARAFTLPRISVSLPDREKDGVRVGVVALVAANWIYLIATR